MMLLEVDPNLVRPGWTALVVIVLLGIVLFFLGRSMIKQFGRIDVPHADEIAGDAAAGSAPGTETDGTRPGSPEQTRGDSSSSDTQAPRIPDLRARTPDGGRAAPPDQR